MIHSRPQAAGFTVVELMIVVAILAVLIAVAAPSFTEFLSKRRVDGALSELVTDLQFARSESVSRNAPVRISFFRDERCYVIHLGSAASTGCGVVNPPAAEIKSVQLDGRLTLDPGASTFYFEFEPVRGMVANSASTDSNSVVVRSSSGTSWELRALLTLMGRVETCSPSGSGKVSGYSDCT
jgi:type IV fimbrial biogenesis protein FimT